MAVALLVPRLAALALALPSRSAHTHTARAPHLRAPFPLLATKDDSDSPSGGHAVGKTQTLPPEEEAVQRAVMAHQKDAARLSQAEDARSLVAYAPGYATLSTLRAQGDGYPSASLVGFATDERGLPLFCFSSMSSHTKDLRSSCRAALCVTADGFKGAADGRVTLVGDVEACDAEAAEELRALYRQKHPDAFWVDFGDFTFYRMTSLKAVNFVGGFARAGNISPEEYIDAEVDAIQAFGKPVMGHMNDDHSDSTVAMVQHYIGLPDVEKADLVQMDKLGFMVKITRKGQTFKLRLPFPRAAENRKDVKTLIVQMTQEAMKNPEVQAAMEARQAAAKSESEAQEATA